MCSNSNTAINLTKSCEEPSDNRSAVIHLDHVFVLLRIDLWTLKNANDRATFPVVPKTKSVHTAATSETFTTPTDLGYGCELWCEKIGTLAAIARRKLARTAPGARDQCLPPSRENASRAAATAISTSSAVPAGMSPSPIPIGDHHDSEKRPSSVRCQPTAGTTSKRSEKGGTQTLTDGGLGGRVDDGQAAPEARLPPGPANEEAAPGDRLRRRHGDAVVWSLDSGDERTEQ